MSPALRDTRQQVQDAVEDRLSTFREPVQTTTPFPEVDLNQEAPLDLVPSACLQPDVSGSVGATSSPHAQDTSDAGQQLRHGSILHSNSRYDPWFPACPSMSIELFDNILFYLGLDHGPQTGVFMAYSLVCRRWAHRCRQALFHNKELKIRSFEDAQTLVKYTTQGSPSFIPVYELISSIRVIQRYSKRQSFCDCLHMFKLELGTVLPKLRFQLDLIGSNLDRGFPSCKKLDISHWRLPPSALTPFSLPYDEIRVKDIQLPSFTGVDKYVRHFAQAHNIMFFDLTWNTSNRQESPISSYREGSHTVEDRSLDVSAKGCTDNLSLCLLLVVAETHPCWQSLLCMLPDDESQQIAIMIRWFGELAGKYQSCLLRIRDPKKSQKPLISVIGAYFYPNCSLHFQLYNLTAENARASDFRVVGVALKVDEREEEVDIDDLRGYLGLFSTLCVVLLRFDSYQGLLAAMKRHRPLAFNPQPVNDQSCKYIFTYRRRSDDEFPEVARLGVDYGSSDYDCVEIDPSTLSPTGRSWARSFDFHSSLIQESLRKTGHIPPASI